MPKEQQPEDGAIRKQIESEKFQLAIASVLPAHVTPARFVRISIAALTRVPKLAQCDPNTVLQCLMQLSQFGLEPDGRNAHLIPFWNSKRSVMECQLIVDYKGLVDLAMRSGKVAFVHADKVCENDVFEWNKGQVVKHEINFKEDRGKPYAYYAIAKMKDGTEQAEAMPREDIDAIRKRSRAANNGPWVTDYDEMAKKTVFRRLSKWLQLSPEYREALEVDADAIEDLRFENAKPVISRAKVPKIEDAKPDENNSSSGAESSKPETDAPSKKAAAAAPKKKFTKPEASEETEEPLKRAGPNEKDVLRRLAKLDKSMADFERVALYFKVLDPGQTWNQITEAQFADCLDSDNWKLVEAELLRA